METRQEQIKQASIEWKKANNPVCMGGDAFSDMIDILNVSQEFIAGAEWADAHPQSPWISLKERMPEPKKRVLFLDNKGVAHLGYNNIDRESATIFSTDTNAPALTHWMPIPEKL